MLTFVLLGCLPYTLALQIHDPAAEPALVNRDVSQLSGIGVFQLGRHIFDATVVEGLRLAADPQFTSARSSVDAPAVPHGLTISYKTESTDGTQWSLEFDHGCASASQVNASHFSTCTIPLGEKVNSLGKVHFARDLIEGASYAVESKYTFRGFLETVLGSGDAPLQVKCPVCGEKCDRESFSEEVKDYLGNMELPVMPCPIPKGEFLFENNTFELTTDWKTHMLDFDNEVKESVWDKDGNVIFRTVVKYTVGPLNAETTGVAQSKFL